jgi:hypothetical protein
MSCRILAPATALVLLNKVHKVSPDHKQLPATTTNMLGEGDSARARGDPINLQYSMTR